MCPPLAKITGQSEWGRSYPLEAPSWPLENYIHDLLQKVGLVNIG